jgi:hypothetical protein
MKKLLLIPVFLLGFVLSFSSFTSGSEYPNGAPAGYTGSPGDGSDCTNCHGGTATPVSGWITSNVPGTGWVPGTNYTITVSVAGTGSVARGFEVSPQKTDGTLLGTLTAGTGNKLVGSGKYVTQSTPITSNPAVWTFTWTAPAAGTGPVTFYGAFAVSKNNTYTSTLTISESTVGISENKESVHLSVFPNPVTDKVNVSFTTRDAGNVSLALYDMTGNEVSRLMESFLQAGTVTKSFFLKDIVKPGIYFLRVDLGGNIASEKIIVK